LTPTEATWDTYPNYLFDIDGTLLNCQDAVHYFAFCEALTTLAGRPLNLDGVTTHGSVDNAILRDALALAGVPEHQWRPRLPAAQSQMGDYVEAHAGELRAPALPGAVPVLGHLQAKGATLATATGNFARIGRAKLAHAGILHYLPVGGWSDAHESRAEVFRAALALLPPGPTCVFGDTPADIAAAHANGLPIIAVATGVFPAETLRHAGADLVVSSLLDLLRTP
jgi:phosphoglycolate phosphatase-like HAD superfamily hydrolase